METAGDDLKAKDRILHAAIRALDTGGEASLRIVDVAKDAGVSQGMIRYYFGDRESLVAQAMATRFLSRYGFMLDVFTERTALCQTPDDFKLLIAQVLDTVFIPERSRLRLERNSDIGNAKDNHSLAEQIAEGRDQLCRDLAAVFESVRVRGLIRPDVDPLSIASFYMAFTHGISLWELGPEFVPREQVANTLKTALFSMLFD